MEPILVCPRCREVLDGVLHVGRLVAHPAGLACARCGAVYPVVDGVPIVLREPRGWLEAELVNVLARNDLPDPVLDALAAGEAGPFRRSRRRARVYDGCVRGPFVEWAREVVGRLEGSVLDLCCGVGSHGRADAVGVDLDWVLLSRFPGRRVLADAIDPPFPGASFDHVLLLNAVDSVRDPLLLLRQADALLRPGGSMVVAVPFAWVDDVTDPVRQIDEETVLGFLASAGFEIRTGEHDWVMASGERTTVTHRCRTIEAQKTRE